MKNLTEEQKNFLALDAVMALGDWRDVLEASTDDELSSALEELSYVIDDAQSKADFNLRKRKALFEVISSGKMGDGWDYNTSEILEVYGIRPLGYKTRILNQNKMQEIEYDLNNIEYEAKVNNPSLFEMREFKDEEDETDFYLAQECAIGAIADNDVLVAALELEALEVLMERFDSLFGGLI